MKRDLLEWAEKANSTGWRRSQRDAIFDKPADDIPPGGGPTPPPPPPPNE